MSKSKTTRSTKIKADPDVAPKTNKVPALRKIIYISQKLLSSEDVTLSLHLERFYHPGKGQQTLFITCSQTQQLLEVIEFAEPRRSWLINSDVCANGKVYLTTPVDVTLLALHHLRKHCTQKALALDSIGDAQDARLMTQFVRPEQLKCVADVKKAGDLHFYKYNEERALAWLALKVRRVATTLKRNGIHCGHSALSQNYAKSEVEETQVHEVDFLRMASDYVGAYIDLELHEALKKYLAIPKEIEALAEEQKAANNKRKSLKSLKANENKKIKLDQDNVSDKLKQSNLLDESVENVAQSPESTAKPTPMKERVLSAKDKALAKGAKGTKSIASFFKK